jgi:GNAT superfamily N-acetyltransferase
METLSSASALRPTIRSASLSDVAALTELVAHYWAFEAIEHFSASRVQQCLTTLLQSPTLGAGWVASAGDRLCGYLLVMHVFSLEHGGIMAEIDELFVLPQYRGTGLGAALLATAEQTLAAGNCVRLQLQLNRGNRQARDFYRRRGYGERTAYELLDKALNQKHG